METLKRNDTLNEYSGRMWKILDIEDDVIFIELITIPFWDNPESIGECDIILMNDIAL